VSFPLKNGSYKPIISITSDTESRQFAQVLNHREVVVRRGVTLPPVRLNDLVHGVLTGQAAVSATRITRAGNNYSIALETAPDVEKRDREQTCCVVVGVGERQAGLVVDSLPGEQEIVIKSLGRFVGDVRGISGATILGDGSIALIVDVNGLLAIATEDKVGAYAA
jgi:chemotaxis protein histidine kinase CheA